MVSFTIKFIKFCLRNERFYWVIPYSFIYFLSTWSTTQKILNSFQAQTPCMQSKFAWHTFSCKQTRQRCQGLPSDIRNEPPQLFKVSFSNSNEKVFPWVADVWFLLLLLLITLALPAEEDLKTPRSQRNCSLHYFCSKFVC